MAPTNPTSAPAAGDACARRTYDFHPLEVFPYFRRFPPSLQRDLAYTFIWNTGLVALFLVVTLVFHSRPITIERAWWTFLVAHCIGYTIHALFAAGGALGLERWIHSRSRIAVAAYYSATATAGVLLGFVVAAVILDPAYLRVFGSPRYLAMLIANSVVISLVIAAIFYSRERKAKANSALVAERLRVERIEREAVVANLRALQAQIEPHFLFNTLANVTSLIDSDPARAKRMLEIFIRFLRASLAGTRRSATTLGDEFALIGDFLEVLKVRMGERLQFRLELPPDLSAVEIPAMLVQPVVENAIEHGLEPKVDGGMVELRAHRESGMLRIEVADTGMGFVGASSPGVGLSNIRERLRLAHGDAARLVIRDNPPQGTIVSIEMPLPAP